MILLEIITTVLAVSGVILNNRKSIYCFYLWFVSNTISLIIHATSSLMILAVRDLIFIFLAIEGMLIWSEIAKKKDEHDGV